MTNPATHSSNESLTFMSDLIRDEERQTEETFTKPVMRETGIIDPSQIHMNAVGALQDEGSSANSSSPAIDPYDSTSLVYVDPCYVLDMKHYLSMTCKLNLP
jgi:hypothetical protein